MRFKTDENLPIEIAQLLVESGHDATRVDEQGLSGVDDSGIAAVCKVEQRAIITLDTDFMDIRTYPPENHVGIIVLRPHRQSIPHLIAMTTRFLLLVGVEPLAGKTLGGLPLLARHHVTRVRR